MANAEWRYLQPEKLTIDPNSHLAEEEWKFWLKTFTNFVEALPRGENTVDKLKVLTAHLSAPMNKLSQNCDFTAVSAQEYKDDMKRDSFINGLSSNFIRQRLLENRTLTFTEAHEKARSIELAKLHCETYTCQDTSSRQMCALQKDETKSNENNVSVIASKKQSRNFTCYF